LARESDMRRVIRRRPTYCQGRALEILGHAIEYLVDSRIYDSSPFGVDKEAVKILTRVNLDIFEECQEVIPLRSRINQIGSQLRAVGLSRVTKY